MRALVRNLAINDPELLAFIPEERWVQRGSLTDPLPTPFAALALTGYDGGQHTGPSRLWSAEWWVYDERGSYLQIDEILDRLARVMTAARQVEDAGWWLTEAHDEGQSPDLDDDVLELNVRHGNFRLLGRKL